MRKMFANNDEDHDLQIPEKSDVLLFAEDLVDYILFQYGRNNGLKWEPVVFRDNFYNAAVPIIRRVIHFLDYILETDHVELFCKMKEANFVNSECFLNFAEILSENYFSKDFDAKCFLIYCLNVSIMAYYFYINGIVEAPELARVDIYQLLQDYYVSADGWKAIRSNAENYVKMLRDSLNELTSSETSHILDEIVDPDKVHEEVSKESNSSFSEKESVLSGNAESNTEQEKERARSKIKGYLQLYAQCSSNSESQIGLCSLREPESLSEDESLKCKLERNTVINGSEMDDKPRPGTSSIDEELILNMKDFKMKMNLSWNEMKSGYPF